MSNLKEQDKIFLTQLLTTTDTGTAERVIAALDSAGSASGDMTKAVYDPANIGQQLVGTTAAQALTNKTGNISQWTNDSGYLTSATGQPLDADLTAIAALGFASTSFLKKTAANTWALDTATYLTSVPISNFVVFSANGNNGTAAVGDWTKPFADPTAAVAAASSGMTIYGFDGTYTWTTNLHKQGVRWILTPNCNIGNTTTASSPAFAIPSTDTLDFYLQGGNFTSNQLASSIVSCTTNTHGITIRIVGTKGNTTAKCIDLEGGGSLDANLQYSDVILISATRTVLEASSGWHNGQGYLKSTGDSALTGHELFSFTGYCESTAGAGFYACNSGGGSITGYMKGGIRFGAGGSATFTGAVSNNDPIVFNNSFCSAFLVGQDGTTLNVTNTGESNYINFGGARGNITNTAGTSGCLQVDNWSCLLTTIINNSGSLFMGQMNQGRVDFGIGAVTLNGGKTFFTGNVILNTPIVVANAAALLDLSGATLRFDTSTTSVDLISMNAAGTVIASATTFVTGTLGYGLYNNTTAGNVYINTKSTTKGIASGTGSGSGNFIAAQKRLILITVTAANVQTDITINGVLANAGAVGTAIVLAGLLATALNALAGTPVVAVDNGDATVSVTASTAGTDYTNTLPHNCTATVQRRNNNIFTDQVGGGLTVSPNVQ